MVTYVSLLPPEVEARLKRFFEEGCSGSIEIHFNAGNIASFRVIETGRVKAPNR